MTTFIRILYIILGFALLNLALSCIPIADAKPTTKPHRQFPHAYAFHHWSYQVAGKALIYRECLYDFRQDPGEAACKSWWAFI